LVRQVRIAGAVRRDSAEASDERFETYPPGVQWAIHAARQSQPVPSRAVLEHTLAEVAARYGQGPIERPAYWGGLRLMPTMLEFWQGRPNRMQDRLRYVRQDTTAWSLVRLAP
jgi:pyridoxamine 5'-phosphate oxidase